MPIHYSIVSVLHGRNFFTEQNCVQVKLEFSLQRQDVARALHKHLGELLVMTGVAQGDLPDSRPVERYARLLDVLLSRSGLPHASCQLNSASADGFYDLLLPFHLRDYSLGCLQFSMKLIELCLPIHLRSKKNRSPATATSAEHELVRFLRQPSYLALGYSSLCLFARAIARDIPCELLAPGSSVLQLGQGSCRQLFTESATPVTSYIGSTLSNNKYLTNQALAKAAIPVALQQQIYSDKQAIAFAEQCGYPVVVKPTSKHDGTGVTVNVKDRQQLVVAVKKAADTGQAVLIEKQLAGDDYRLLVVDGHCVAAAKVDVPCISADGVRTVRQLVRDLNHQPGRGIGAQAAQSVVPLNHGLDLLLAKQGVNLDSVPAAGQTIALDLTPQINAGAVTQDVTEQVHVEIVRMAEKAARVMGLDVAGIDYRSTDIGLSPKISGGAVFAVQSPASLRFHAHDGVVNSSITDAVVSMAFPEADNGRIPVIAFDRNIAADDELTDRLSRLFSLNRQQVAIANDVDSVNRLMADPDNDIALLGCNGLAVQQEGVGVTSCHTSVITGTDEQRQLQALLVRTACNALVLNHDCAALHAFIDENDDKKQIWVSREFDSEALQQVVNAGHRYVAWFIQGNGQLLRVTQPGSADVENYSVADIVLPDRDAVLYGVGLTLAFNLSVDEFLQTLSG